MKIDESKPSNWKYQSIKEITKKITSGATPSRKIKSYFFPNEINWVKTKELKNCYIYETEEGISAEGLKNSSAKILPESTLLVAMYGATVGKVGLIKKEMACNQACCAIIADENKIDIEFLFYKFLNWKKKIKSLATGAAQQNLSLEKIKEFIFSFPEVTEQKKISNFIRSLDSKIELNQKINKTLEDIAITLFESWFIRFDPVRKKITNELPEEITNLFPNSLDVVGIDEIPKGWEIQKYGLFTKPKRGKIIVSTKLTYGKIPVVAGGLKPTYFHNESNVNAPVVTISGSGANAGFVNLFHKDIWASDCSYISKKESKYIFTNYLFLKINQKKITNSQHGAAQPHINPNDLMRLEIPKIPNSILEKFENIVEPIFEKIFNSKDEIENLFQLRDIYLPKLISGELKISETEKLINRKSVQ
jgi:type I restriction enzyme S subunit